LQRQQQGSGQQAGGDTAVQEMNLSFHGFLGRRPQDDDDSEGAQRDGWFKEMLGWLMVVATVAASVTYQAGLNPPGGFWQDANDERHVRYMVFYYFNGTAFVMSLVIMVLLMSERFYQTEAKVFALLLTTFLDLTSLIGAYMAGSTRCFSSCIYIIVITCVAFVVVIYIGEYVPPFLTFITSNLSRHRYICSDTYMWNLDLQGAGSDLLVPHDKVSLHENAGVEKMVPNPQGSSRKTKKMAERQRRHAKGGSATPKLAASVACSAL
jgi:hypothetical protein